MRAPARALAFGTLAVLTGITLAGVTSVLVASTRLPSIAAVRALHVSSEAELLDRDGRLVQTMRLDPRSRRLAWVPLTEVSPRLPEAVLAVEDRRFRQHFGVDPLAIAGAVRDGLAGNGWRGASTLTMQLAAGLQRDAAAAGGAGAGPVSGRRGFAAKLAQARDALALELRWSKDEILEAYLNRVSFRGELAGIGAASRTLFGRSPASLDAVDSWLLAASLRSPAADADRIAHRACALARWSAPTCEAARVRADATLSGAGRMPPAATLAPHLARRLLRAPGERVVSTLDARLQAFVRDTVGAQLDALGAARARDGAAVVVDNATGEVLAYVGSAGAESTAAAVDGARAPRQAGSTLKPFLYALALERRLLTPASLLDDSPLGLTTASGLYVPQNYDRGFRGLVSLRTALASSLNVPAVRALLLLGPEPFHRQLAALGYEGLRSDPEWYGYSLALGTADVTLLEQANAYRTLANGGRWSPLRFTPDARRAGAAPVLDREHRLRTNAGLSQVVPRQVIEPRAAWLVGDILADRAARAATFGLESALSTRAWTAVKTGTSKDMRDNWCIGWSRRYTVAVWVGNFEGDPMRAVSGVAGAAPAWAAIMNHLESGAADSTPPLPDGLVAQRVVFTAPEAPRDEWFLQGTEQPLSAPAAARARSARIVAPADGTILALDPDIPSRLQRVRLLADPAAGARWHVDGKALPAEALWAPVPGRHRIELRDADGRVLDEVGVEVRGAWR